MMVLAQVTPFEQMSTADQWGWVAWAYTFAAVVLVVYTVSIATRLSRSRKRLDERS